MIIYKKCLRLPFFTIILSLVFLLEGCGGGGNSQSKTNTPPRITSPASKNIEENSTGIIYLATALDMDGDNLKFSISGGVDGSLFSIDGLVGGLSFITPPNFELPSNADKNNIYLVELAVTDGRGGRGNLSISLTVTDVNDAPVFVSATTINIPENSVSTGYTVIASDEDGDKVTYNLMGGEDLALFDLDSITGKLELKNSGDFELPLDLNKDNNYVVEISAKDGIGGISTMQLILTITDVSILLPRISFPTSGANLGGNIKQMTVAGFLQDLEDDEVLESDIKSMQVNEIPRISSVNRTDQWSALVPLSINNSTFNVKVESMSGSIKSQTQNFSNTKSITFPLVLVLDKLNNRLITVNVEKAQIIGINLTSGNNFVISGASRGFGFPLFSPRDLVADFANNQIFVLNSSGIIVIDLATGDRTDVSKVGFGTGPDFNLPESLALDVSNNRLLVAGQAQLISVDLNTGNRTLLSDRVIGTGPIFNSARSVTLDILTNQLYIADTQNGSQSVLIKVDLDSGNRTLFYDPANSTNPIGFTPLSIEIDQVKNQLVVADSETKSILMLNLTNGQRTIVSNLNMGDGPDFLFPASLVIDSDNNTVYVGDFLLQAILRVNSASGNREVIAKSEAGLGPKFQLPVAGVIDTENNRMFVVDGERRGAIFEVNLVNGDRKIISDQFHGAGPEFLAPSNIDFDILNNKIFVSDSELRKLFSINVSNGNRTIISSSDIGVGTGVGIFRPRSIQYDKVNNRIFVLSTTGILTNGDVILSVDLTNGNRTMISDANIGTGPEFAFPRSLNLDSRKNRLLLINGNGVMSVDVTNGNRTIVSNNTVGTGPIFVAAHSLVFDEINDRVIVNDGKLIDVDLKTGNRKILSTLIENNGELLKSPQTMSLDLSNSRIFIVDFLLKALFVVDIESGDRVIASQ